MFSFFPRGRARPPSTLTADAYGPIRYDDARFRAWALALGHERPADLPTRPARPHRGQLPDVDFSNARPVPRRRFLFGVVLAALGLRTHAPPSGEAMASGEAGPVADAAGHPYDERGRVVSLPPILSETGAKPDRARAA
jgi:hypothetical protein